MLRAPMSQESQPKLLVTTREAARLMGCALRTIEKMVADGDLVSVKLGRARRIRMTDIQRFIEQGGTRGA